MQQSNYSKEQVHKIQATPQEMDAWEALRREPGLMGRLARRGKHMKRDYVGGRRSFEIKAWDRDVTQEEQKAAHKAYEDRQNLNKRAAETDDTDRSAFNDAQVAATNARMEKRKAEEAAKAAK